ncbi:MAG: Helix-turn-helix domain [Cyanobacteria bacterium RYN_339]|nr:Helix-turn-helix domain [Cyanobacteria bacterium RYN_339]
MNDFHGFGAQIRARRVVLGWTVREAAPKLGVSRSRLSEIERGLSYSTGNATRPSRELVERVAEVYDLPRDLLLVSAGYPVDTPLELSPATRDMLVLFERLTPNGQRVAMGMLRILVDGPAPPFGDA